MVARVATDVAETTESGEDQVDDPETCRLWPLPSKCGEGEVASGVEG